jgi:hypothetical protein
MVAFALLDRIEVSSLEILDEGKREKCAIVDILDDRRDFSPTEVPCSAESPFAGDNLESILAGTPAYRDRL